MYGDGCVAYFGGSMVVKEYLDTRNGYKLIEAPESEALEPHASEWILVPKGANIYAKCNIFGDYKFLPYEVDGDWGVVWQRQAQPEELPFIDGEQSLNDQYAEIEKIRQAAKETEYLMQGKNGDKLMESLAQFHNTDRGVDFDSFELLPRTATEIADAALTHIRERASTYDQPEGERSASKTAQAFNAITGHNINESEVWLMLQILKDVRQWSRESYHQDSAEDCIAYSALKAESLERNR